MEEKKGKERNKGGWKEGKKQELDRYRCRKEEKGKEMDGNNPVERMEGNVKGCIGHENDLQHVCSSADGKGKSGFH